MKSMFKSAFSALIVVLALSGLTAASALAAGAPVVETKPATSVDGTEAIVNASVDSNGASAKYYFEYGPTISYGSRTAEGGDAVGKIEVHKATTELNVKTEYHFRVVATNSYGTSYGADQVFTTTAGSLPVFAVANSKEQFPVTYSASVGGASWQSRISWQCTNGTMQGKINGAKTVTQNVITFNGCKEGKNIACNTEGAAREEIKTNALTGTLVYLSKSAKTVAVDFKPESGTLLAQVRCGAAYLGEFRGSIAMPITSVNKLSTSFTLRSTSSNKSYETESDETKTASLEANWAGVWESAFWELESVLTTNKQIEIKA